MKKFIEKYFSLPVLLKLLLLSVIVLRIVLFTLPSFKIDMGDWQAWAARLVEVGPPGFYINGMLADYLPFFYLILWFISKIFVFIFGTQAIFTLTFDIYIRIISNLFDFLTAYLIYKIVKNYNNKFAFLGSLLYLVNPGVMFNSSVWGQTDSIPTFFFVFSLFLLNEMKNPKFSSVSLVLSALVKPLNVAAFPVVGIRIIKNFDIKNIFYSIIYSIVVFFTVTIPFFVKDPIFGVLGHLFNSLNVYPYTSLNAYNFWGLLVGFWKSDSTLLFGIIPYHILGYALFFLILGVVLLPYLKLNKKYKEFDYYSAAILCFAFFLFLTRIHERHLFPLFSLLMISFLIFKSRILIFSYVFASFIYFLNEFYSYYYYNFAYSNPNATNIIFRISSDYSAIFSVILILIFFVILVEYFRKILAVIKK